MSGVGLIAATMACKKSAPAGPSTPAPAATIAITATGANPRNVDIALGDRVLFVNNDGRSHNVSSDPHPEHSDCPSVNQVGFLVPGQSRETGNFVTPRVCGFHDHDDPDNASLRGTITTK